jgi:hypothetical protein
MPIMVFRFPCFICKQTIDPGLAYDSTASALQPSSNSFQFHFACYEMRAVKAEFDDLLEKGQGGECPGKSAVGGHRFFSHWSTWNFQSKISKAHTFFLQLKILWVYDF